MKKLFLLGIGILALASCQQDETTIDQPAAAKGVTATISNFEYGNTRSTLTPTDNSVKFAWTEGDRLAVMAPDGTEKYRQQGLTMQNGTGGGQTASFVGSSFQLAPGVKYVAYYPGINDLYKTDAIVTENYSEQTQEGNNSAAHLVNADILASEATEPRALNQVDFRLKHLGAVLRVDFSELTPGANYTKLTIESLDQGFNATETYNLFTAERTATSNTTSLTLTLKDVAVATDGTLSLYMMIPPIDLTGKSLNVFLGNSSTDEAVSFNNIAINSQLAANKYYIISLAPQKETIETQELDLPSGILWAVQNTVVNPQEEYYAWGETETKDLTKYNMANYKFADPRADNGFYAHTSNLSEWRYWKGFYMRKYVTDSWYTHRGYTDNLTTLEDADDVAHQLYGDDYYIPTKEEWQELIDNTTQSYSGSDDNPYGVRCVKFTSKTDPSKYIYIPAVSGAYGPESVTWDNDGANAASSKRDESYGFCFHGEYWSSTLNTDKDSYGNPSNDYAYYFDVYARNNSVSCKVSKALRSNGLAIRVIKRPKK